MQIFLDIFPFKYIRLSPPKTQTVFQPEECAPKKTKHFFLLRSQKYFLLFLLNIMGITSNVHNKNIISRELDNK